MDRLTTAETPGLAFYRNRIYDQNTGRWTQEDPLGVAGGLNLYQFNGNDPVSFGDPFGLWPDWCCKKLNPVKAAVGVVNVVRGVSQAASGAVLLTAGVATSPLGPISVPADVLGTAKLASGLAKVNRGAQQVSESLDDPNGPSARNLLGLLPMGQKFDDPTEPTPIEYGKEKVKKFVADPAKAAKEAIKDFFAIE